MSKLIGDMSKSELIGLVKQLQTLIDELLKESMTNRRKLMTKLQRYKVAGNGWHQSDDGDWVKYDDHIAEVETLKKDIKHWQDKLETANSVIEIQQSEIDELEHQLTMEHCGEWNINKYKAEGIRECRHLAKHDSVIWIRLGEYADKLRGGNDDGTL